jgi:hypothetical protein
MHAGDTCARAEQAEAAAVQFLTQSTQFYTPPECTSPSDNPTQPMLLGTYDLHFVPFHFRLLFAPLAFRFNLISLCGDLEQLG